MKKLIITFLFLAIYLLLPHAAQALLRQDQICKENGKFTADSCGSGLECIEAGDGDRTGYCRPIKTFTPSTVEGVFGKIQPPKAVSDLGYGSEGVSNFINYLVRLIYIIAGIIFVFMVLWSAFEWIISGGDKEKVGAARQRLTYAIIGITVLALAFVIIRVIGQITGFEFFAGQKTPVLPTPTPIIVPLRTCGPNELPDADNCRALTTPTPTSRPTSTPQPTPGGRSEFD